MTLTEKLLARPNLIAQIRSLILDPDRAHLVPYNTTERERELAVRLGIPMYGADPKCFHLGTKSGARRVFADEGVSHPLGVENLRTLDAMADAICGMRRQKPGIARIVAKLNEGVSGAGNANVDLAGLPVPGDPLEKASVLERLRQMKFESAEMTLEHFVDTLATFGGIVEELISGRDFRSPSAQLRVTPLGEVEALSTHDQLLGGPSGQAYLGCTFPASPDYAVAIMREAQKVGGRLMREGVLGRFALDFVAVRNDKDEWEVYAIEINLRKGGTTHTFQTLQYLTGGHYDGESGLFRTPGGQARYYYATDNLTRPAYRRLLPEDLIDIAVEHDLHFDQTIQQGVTFNLIGALSEFGKLGVVSIADSVERASEVFERTVTVLDQEAGRTAI
jgi:hypothetical protein